MPMPFFSVIIPTRNRPGLFRVALDSVLAQSFQDVEVLVVNDGSGDEHLSEYEAILGAVDSSRVRSFTLISRQRGHGGAYACNFGAAAAVAPYLCFLDDDDCWLDRDHLTRAYRIIAASASPVDLYMTDQIAFLRNEQRAGPIWVEDLPAILAGRDNRPDSDGVYTVSVDDLLQSHGFCHVNTLIVRRALFEGIGGMEEAIRWEYDRDFYLRLIDRATTIKYTPVTVARHNIPDPTKTANMTTVLSGVERCLHQLVVLNRVLHLTRHPGIRAYARRHKGYTLKRIAESLSTAGRPVEAAFYAREALGAGPTVKWAAYTAWLTMRALVDRT
jgi:glycosyltransferase involved in cell wall biosynthesis